MGSDSDGEALAAAALALNVRVVELEALVEAFPDEVQLGPIHVGQAFRVDQDLQAMAFENDILGGDLVSKLQLDRKSTRLNSSHT